MCESLGLGQLLNLRALLTLVRGVVYGLVRPPTRSDCPLEYILPVPRTLLSFRWSPGFRSTWATGLNVYTGSIQRRLAKISGLLHKLLDTLIIWESDQIESYALP